MEAETQLAKLIKVTNDRAKYDTQVKKLLANESHLGMDFKNLHRGIFPPIPPMKS